mmetsp:Transcript_49657/g.153381  ORF Transcript_49657/g.153381 Transcript_49657/m.153381 type:complete len:225 (-) Transcript_49657:227-901(-)
MRTTTANGYWSTPRCGTTRPSTSPATCSRRTSIPCWRSTTRKRMQPRRNTMPFASASPSMTATAASSTPSCSLAAPSRPRTPATASTPWRCCSAGSPCRRGCRPSSRRRSTSSRSMPTTSASRSASDGCSPRCAATYACSATRRDCGTAASRASPRPCASFSKATRTRTSCFGSCTAAAGGRSTAVPAGQTLRGGFGRSVLPSPPAGWGRRNWRSCRARLRQPS